MTLLIMMMTDSHRHNAELHREIELLKAVTQNPTNLILLCLPPKTGDHTLMKTFEANNINYLNLWHLSKSFNLDLFNIKPIKIITAIREPIDQHISSIYQNIKSDPNCESRWISLYLTYILENDGSFEDNLKNLKDNFLKKGGGIQDFFDLRMYCRKLSSADGKIKPVIIENLEEFSANILDLMAYSFNHETGYAIIQTQNIEVFVYQLEKLNDIVPQLSDWATNGGKHGPSCLLVL